MDYQSSQITLIEMIKECEEEAINKERTRKERLERGFKFKFKQRSRSKKVLHRKWTHYLPSMSEQRKNSIVCTT